MSPTFRPCPYRLGRLIARQEAYWRRLLGEAQAQIEAEDRAYWGDLYDDVFGGSRS